MTVKNAGYTLSDVQSTVRFNIKNIILTNPGERIMIPDFGVGIKQALFENSSIELMQEIQHRINEQMSLYAPYVDILELIITPTDEHSINIKLKYEIDFVEILDSIELDITNI